MRRGTGSCVIILFYRPPFLTNGSPAAWNTCTSDNAISILISHAAQYPGFTSYLGASEAEEKLRFLVEGIVSDNSHARKMTMKKEFHQFLGKQLGLAESRSGMFDLYGSEQTRFLCLYAPAWTVSRTKYRCPTCKKGPKRGSHVQQEFIWLGNETFHGFLERVLTTHRSDCDDQLCEGTQQLTKVTPPENVAPWLIPIQLMATGMDVDSVLDKLPLGITLFGSQYVLSGMSVHGQTTSGQFYNSSGHFYSIIRFHGAMLLYDGLTTPTISEVRPIDRSHIPQVAYYCIVPTE